VEGNGRGKEVDRPLRVHRPAARSPIAQKQPDVAGDVRLEFWHAGRVASLLEKQMTFLLERGETV